MGKRELIDIAGCLHAETEKAILFSDTGEKKDAGWLAKSQIEFERGAGGGQDDVRYVTVTLPEWLALERGLI